MRTRERGDRGRGEGLFRARDVKKKPREAGWPIAGVGLKRSVCVCGVCMLGERPAPFLSLFDY